jgi:Zn-dependent M28 family amino/carboxypeptidase
VPQDRIALNVNLDMVSRSDKREIFIAGPNHYPDLKAPLEEVAKRAPITVLFGHDKPVAVAGGVEDWTNQSDHGPFHAAKICSCISASRITSIPQANRYRRQDQPRLLR